MPADLALHGCGPTAAVNSFVFLQNKFPAVYGKMLVPELPRNDPANDLNGDGDVDQTDDMIAVANVLAGQEFMKTICAGCATSKSTFRYDFMDGKKKYIESKVPKKTSYAAQDSPALAAFPNLKPDFAKREDPTWQFLRDNLMTAEDVEILLTLFNPDGTEKAGHYVTVTNIKWTDGDMDGIIDAGEGATLGVIDPNSGMFKEYGLFQDPTTMRLIVKYPTKTGLLDVTITAAVKESYIPEPGTLSLLAVGLLACGVIRRRRAAGGGNTGS